MARACGGRSERRTVILSRRRFLRASGGIAAATLLGRSAGATADETPIEMAGNTDGSKVWFVPWGILVRPGATIRWINRDRGNSHTATAYHPQNEGHPLRLPDGAAAWNSDYLLPDEFFAVTLTVSGIYDYFCVPHEHAGMVGRIVVLAEGDAPPAPSEGNPLPELGYDPFPPVERIVAEGSLFRT
jgi:plastocyanin